MKHIVLSETFKFTTEPLPAFRGNLAYGRNKRAREFLPVKDLVPAAHYVVTDGETSAALYSGSDQHRAEEVRGQHDANRPVIACCMKQRAGFEATPATLPEGMFQVIKTREKGTIMIVPGGDRTSRALVFVGCNGGFRGGVSLIQSETNALILKECSAGNACESRVDVVALMGVGQKVVFHTFGRRTDEVIVHEWTGIEVKQAHFSKEEWDHRTQLAAPVIEDAETL